MYLRGITWVMTSSVVGIRRGSVPLCTGTLSFLASSLDTIFRMRPSAPERTAAYPFTFRAELSSAMVSSSKIGCWPMIVIRTSVMGDCLTTCKSRLWARYFRTTSIGASLKLRTWPLAAGAARSGAARLSPQRTLWPAASCPQTLRQSRAASLCPRTLRRSRAAPSCRKAMRQSQAARPPRAESESRKAPALSRSSPLRRRLSELPPRPWPPGPARLSYRGLRRGRSRRGRRGRRRFHRDRGRRDRRGGGRGLGRPAGRGWRS